ncbi:hypothetical protein COO60DRAFT_1540928 [Scenedesmus sp. NREL 46B-D3]|nr:hypothetical protein COO60DRAFT_1540928 [Scenedesmus sp. NREL 46B-D3]
MFGASFCGYWCCCLLSLLVLTVHWFACSTQGLEDVEGVSMPEVDEQLGHCSMRARFEEMEVRLGRNLEAFSAAQAQADKAPPTVERVLRDVAAGRALAQQQQPAVLRVMAHDACMSSTVATVTNIVLAAPASMAVLPE